MLRTASDATTGNVGMLRSITAASMATAAGMADLQHSHSLRQSEQSKKGHELVAGAPRPNNMLGCPRRSHGARHRARCYRCCTFLCNMALGVS